MWSDDIKCKYMCMFPLKNLALKESILNSVPVIQEVAANAVLSR